MREAILCSRYLLALASTTNQDSGEAADHDSHTKQRIRPAGFDVSFLVQDELLAQKEAFSGNSCRRTPTEPQYRRGIEKKDAEHARTLHQRTDYAEEVCHHYGTPAGYGLSVYSHRSRGRV